jgi:glycosyltransferase involved in cell wall biosynthesis
MSKTRVLVAGWVNSPHVIAWGDALLELGCEVHLAGQFVERWPTPANSDRFASLHVLSPGRVPGIRDRWIGHGLARVARAVEPDLVHAHWAPGYGWMAARARLRPLVTSAWGSDLLQANARLSRRSRKALRGSDLVLADSAHLAEVARSVAGPEVRVEVIQWGVDLTLYKPDAASRASVRRELGLANRPTVLTTRALDPLYNPDVLLRAVAELRRRLPDVQLVLKHPEPSLPAALQTQLRDLALEDATRVVGFVDEQALAGLYRAADAYVSIPSSDSSPRSVWEALACGTAAVISDLPWAREALRDREHARLVPIDAEAIADALEQILGDAGTAAALAERGRALTVATMDRRDQLTRLQALYREVLG